MVRSLSVSVYSPMPPFSNRRPLPPMLIGHGYDLHRLDARAPLGRGKPLMLGGVIIPHDRGCIAHSDGDVLLHAVTDAVLGALGDRDIGQIFPDNDPANADRASEDFLRAACVRMQSAGYEVGNLDTTVICQTPKISPHKDAIVRNLARLLACEPSRVNVKGKTHEGVDAVGEGRAIEAHAVVLLRGLRNDQT